MEAATARGATRRARGCRLSSVRRAAAVTRQEEQAQRDAARSQAQGASCLAQRRRCTAPPA
eukprot:1873040-Prymnesium_polylepis.1